MPADELLSQLAVDEAGLIITDPPWDLDGSGRFAKMADYDRMEPREVFDDLEAARRCLVDGGHLYLFAPASSLLYRIADVARERGWEVNRTLAWGKGAAGGLGAYRNAWEPVLLLSNGKARTFPGTNCRYPSLLEFDPPAGRTAKPWGCYRIFMLMSARVGELVVDPYCGTNPLEKAVRRLDRDQPWVAGDVLTPVEVADSVRERSQREDGELEDGRYTVERGKGHEQARLGFSDSDQGAGP